MKQEKISRNDSQEQTASYLTSQILLLSFAFVQIKWTVIFAIKLVDINNTLFSYLYHTKLECFLRAMLMLCLATVRTAKICIENQEI